MRKIVKAVKRVVAGPSVAERIANDFDLKRLIEFNGRIREIEKELIGTTLEEAVANGDYKGKEKRHLQNVMENSRIIEEMVT